MDPFNDLALHLLYPLLVLTDIETISFAMTIRGFLKTENLACRTSNLSFDVL